ncbi:tyrosine-type recombinase/integrase [Mesorhizobium sp. ZC-5]|uniref:tyrosine-type recombinase/integrase n=1 Tax=Mesorhizobium sp. ZC-5 TaxID=2986066 RepID=UPI0021E89F18|nr:site-specific integrase [Mesorhizobium sp. ZC-5]MCV3239667.1 integrase arm-type DNA-binding domain-containing protein [Mesorhizobium sp. ZC-5]
MVRTINKLSALKVDKLAKPGLYADGLGLYLQVAKGGSKSWLFRFMLNGTARKMGLGSVNTVTLAMAREKATDCRRTLLDAVDPIEQRQQERLVKLAEAAGIMTFKDAAGKYIKSHRAGWKNLKHADQWTATLETYVYPVFGHLGIGAVDVALVLKALEPIWTTKPETASRVRGRIEKVLDWAAARGLRKGENPARWRGHLDSLLPARGKVAKVKHHAALPYAEIGQFMAVLRAMDGLGAKALEFAILTATRTGEIVGAEWSEIDLDGALWVIPGARMKAGKEHRVPLSKRAVALLRALPREKDSHFVFIGEKAGKPLSNMAMLMTLRRMERADLTVHGFRSTFRDWGAEQTAYPNEMLEMALAHTVSDKTEAAYRRGDMMEKRRRLMQDWADYCDRVRQVGEGSPVPIRGTGNG